MVKHFLLEQNFNCSLLTFFQTFIQDPTFCEKFHHNCGDSNIFITEWISFDKDIWQRFCFFTIKLDVTGNKPSILFTDFCVCSLITISLL